MMARARIAIWPVLVSLSQSLQVVAGFILFVVHLTDNLPSEDETTSSRVGRKAMTGDRYGLALEAMIDWLAVRFGDQPGHCRRNIEAALLGHPPTP